MVPKDDMDVSFCTNFTIFRRKGAQVFSFWLIYCQASQGCNLSWKCSHIAYVKASPIPVQEWTVHVFPVPCCFSIRVASIFNYLRTW
uniref:Uncharacterized protein n=1 Tax=Salix viminalis TaxID=40686 RepID=A0A6N2KVD9_SALVM